MSGVAVAMLGAVALVGWVLRVRGLVSVAPGVRPTKANTGIVLILAGVALVCLRGGSRRWWRVGAALGLFIMVVGAAVCFETMVRPVDELVFRDAITRFPGRPSPLAGLGGLALGGALASVDWCRAPAWIYEVLTGLMAALVIFGLVGWACGLAYVRGTVNGPGIIGWVGLALAAVGVIALRPDGLAQYLIGTDTSARLTRVLLPLAVLAPITLGGGVFALEQAGLFAPRAALSVFALAMTVTLSAVVLALVARVRRADAEVRELASIVSCSSDAILVAEGGVFRHVNQAAEEMFGYTASELIGEPVSMLHPRERALEARELVMRAHDAGAASVETQRIRRDGSLIDVSISVGAVRDHAGHAIGSAAIARDITERKRAERETARLAAVVHSSHDAIVGLTLAGIITSFNPAAERLYGFGAQEAIGRPTSLLFAAGQQRQLAAGLLARVAGGEQVAGIEWCQRTNDGRLVDVDMTLSPVRDQNGAIIGASAITRDMTDRKRAAAALREAQELFRRAFEDAPIGMAMLTLDGRYSQVNAAFCEIVGRSAEQLVGATVESITHPDDIERELEDRRLLLQREHATLTLEKRYLHASGDPVHVAAQSTLLRSEDSAPLQFLIQTQDITDRRRHEQQLEYLAHHDALTGLLNRRAFNHELEAHAALVARYEPVGAVLVIDLDQFKFINDTLGHQTGDEVILHTARLLASRLRSSDVIARLGGDEFGILLPRSTPTHALEVADSLLAALHDHALRSGGLNRTITASIGVASFAEQPGMSGSDALINADLAMYDAKEEGRDRVCTFSTSDSAPARMKVRITWAHRIQDALQHDRFTLLAQPIVDLHKQTTTQYELLLRMRDEHDELIAPDAFITIAERLGMMQQIDTWVITNALRMLAELDDASSLPALEINLSGGSLGDPKILQYIERELQRTGVDPSRLIFEVTETVAVASISQARAFGERISDIGCRFALDDFGAGFSSFAYLKHLHYELIKIDSEFVRNCTTNNIDQVLIQSLVQIARRLGKHTIAEGIANEQTTKLLIKLGVDYGQGYHLGAPAPLTDYIHIDHPSTEPTAPAPLTEHH